MGITPGRRLTTTKKKKVNQEELLRTPITQVRRQIKDD
jgi:hypothetical protein